ncbi:ABC transporter substrate-binding protein [Aquabacterium sp. A08]|uniref:substrate-binding periplasmic protein n=1 Tax=Aquabacterium sp. A08 TaxID=2718532 RepID=UPI00141DCFF9|nr:transporter substrate-binding domain-containing protein [Aquabacterium sp. A08]NIC40921.1 amino acid ABC transporter substrate-binding protein [Aquabacterium sp. A08]NIC43652.1 amino acid ABC transporter substrate-binding protein [Aquabacterium sp. A08]
MTRPPLFDAPPHTALSRRRLLAAVPAALATGWLPAHATELQDLDKVRASGTLKVAVYKDNAPYSGGPGNDVQGLDVSLARGLARELNLQLSLLPFDAGEKMNDDLRNMVWRGHYLGYGPADVMLHVPVDKYLMAQNRQTLIFAPYAREVLTVFHRLDRLSGIRSGDDLHNQTLGAERGSGAASILMGYRGGMLRDQVRIYPSGTEAAQAVLQGEVTAAYVTRAQAEAAMFAARVDRTPYGLTELGLPGLADNGWPIGMAVKSEHKALALALEAALQRLRDKGELLAMFREHGLTMVAP